MSDDWKDRQEFAVWANTPDGKRHRYCLPTDYHQAERVAKELRASGRSKVSIRDFNAVDDLSEALRALLASPILLGDDPATVAAYQQAQRALEKVSTYQPLEQPLGSEAKS